MYVNWARALFFMSVAKNLHAHFALPLTSHTNPNRLAIPLLAIKALKSPMVCLLILNWPLTSDLCQCKIFYCPINLFCTNQPLFSADTVIATTNGNIFRGNFTLYRNCIPNWRFLVCRQTTWLVVTSLTWLCFSVNVMKQIKKKLHLGHSVSL